MVSYDKGDRWEIDKYYPDSSFKQKVIHKLRQKQHKMVTDWVIESSNSCPSVLDVACGGGDYSITIASQLRHAKVVAIDNSNAMIRQSVKRCLNLPNMQVLSGDLTNLELKDHYDFLLCMDTLHHFTDAELVHILEGFHKVLRPGGVVIVDIKNADNHIVSRVYNQSKKRNIYRTTRERGVMETLLIGSGFKVVEVKGVAFTNPYLVFFAQKR
jgi:ubiquinone/menaquinone biosynthesis C-methylase UbiE